MPTVSLNYKNSMDIILSKNKSEYYLKLVISQTLECLNSNCISYVDSKNTLFKNPNKNFKIDTTVILSTVYNQKLIPHNHNGIQVFFTPGDPKSKRLAEIMADNLKNIYYDPLNVTIHPKEKNKSNTHVSSKTYVYLCLGYESNKKDVTWLKENTEEISQNIIMSLTEYFGLPFVPCIRPLKAISKSDSSIFSKPSTKSKIIGHIEKNKITKINGQWEDWYIIGRNNHLGYIQSKFIDIL